MFRYTKSLFRPLLQCQRSYSAVLEKSPLDTLRARLYYQSKKRGILENDLLVGGFADKSRLQNLNEAELKDYDVLINGEIMEWDLFYYLTGKHYYKTTNKPSHKYANFCN